MEDYEAQTTYSAFTPVKSDSVKFRLHWSNPKVCNDKVDRALLLVADPSRFKTATDTAKLP